jgi:hypothetical protein
MGIREKRVGGERVVVAVLKQSLSANDTTNYKASQIDYLLFNYLA